MEAGLHAALRAAPERTGITDVLRARHDVRTMVATLDTLYETLAARSRR